VKTERLLWLGVTVYFVVIAIVYGAVGGSAAGIIVLLAAAAFGGLVTGWMWRWSARHGSAEPVEETSGDGTTLVGEFPEASLRPLGIAAGAAIAVLGIPLGSWMSVAGVALLASQLGLVVRDHDR
jgi:hypothetical protein